jgi:cyclic pyranopterin phosphate synthase
MAIRNIKLTAEQPSIRDDIVDIVRSLHHTVDEVSMTTNARLLGEKASALREAGLARVNISLHTLNPSTFNRITCSDYESQVKRGIETALRCGLNPVKLNMVVMKDINTGEIPDLVEYSRETGAILQLIEFQELENGSMYYDEFHYDLKEVEDSLEEKSQKVVKRALHHRKVYHLENGAKVEVVRPMHNSEFCAYCTRLRLTSDGKLKACLMRDDNLVSLVDLIRRGERQETLVEAFTEAIRRREPYWGE